MIKFTHIPDPTHTDGRGALRIEATNQAEVQDLCRTYRIFDKDTPEGLIAYAEALKAGTLVYEAKSDKRPYYEVESALDHEFTIPYEQAMERMTGYTGLFDLDLTDKHPRRLCATHHTDEFRLEQGHFAYRGYISSEDWNGKTALDRANFNFEDYVKEDVGNRPLTPEFIQSGNGSYQRNPKYATGYRERVKPSVASHHWILQALFDLWLETHANDAQKDVVRRWNELHKPSRSRYGDLFIVKEYTLYVPDPNGTCNWDGQGKMVTVLSWDDFRKL